MMPILLPLIELWHFRCPIRALLHILFIVFIYCAYFNIPYIFAYILSMIMIITKYNE